MDNSVWGVIAIAYGVICLAIGLFKVPAGDEPARIYNLFTLIYTATPCDSAG